MKLETSDIMTVVGWVVAFLLGVLLALITQRINRIRKRLGWSLVGESNVLSEAALEDIVAGFQVPLEIRVDGAEVTDLSIIRVMVANIGTVELKELSVLFNFGEDARVYVGRYLGDLGVYRQALRLEKQENTAALRISHINRAQSFEMEFLVGHYHAGDFSVDMAEPGVLLKRVSRLWLEAGPPIMRLVSVGPFGIKFDATALQTSLLVEEVRGLRQLVGKHLKEKSPTTESNATSH